MRSVYLGFSMVEPERVVLITHADSKNNNLASSL